MLNDYAHLGASYGLPLLAAVIFLISWCLLRGTSPLAKMATISLSAAMFFQGVVRIPITFFPLCISLGILLGERPPWRRENWRHIPLPMATFSFSVIFLGAWCVVPLLLTDKTVRAGADWIVVSGKRQPPLTIAFVEKTNLANYGREARAVASLGLRAIITKPRAVAEIQRTYGTNTWFVGDSGVGKRIPPDKIWAPTGMERGVRAVRKAFDLSGMRALPAPDKPYPTGAVVVAFYAAVLALLVRECFISMRLRLAVGAAAASGGAVLLMVCSTNPGWREENRQTAEWARQMRSTEMPEGIYKQYVLDPDITPAFTLRNRREVWYTFYQVCNVEDPREMLHRVKEAIDVQVMTCPGTFPSVRPFDEIWKTRTCSFTERWYLLAAVLRTLNVPARMRAGRAEMWVEGSWLPTVS